MKKTWFLSDYRYLFACIGKFLKIMRLTVFLITLTCLQTFALSNYAQTQKLELKVTNASITEVLDRIENQSDFFFFYNNKNVSLDSKVSLELKDKTINEVLDALFAGTDISYTINNRQIVLSGSVHGSSLQQERTVSGKVNDDSGQPLPGVTVLEKGTINGTITDFDGNYTIANVPAGSTLVFSFVGMRTQEFVVGNQSTINVVMEEDAIGIEEVVAIGYGTQKRVNLSGAVSSVSSDVLEDRPITNLGQGLQGTIPNLQVSQNYAPGQGATFNIRGTTSLNGGSPLVLVDGVVQDPNLLNPDDVESVSVLKDAASAAIYGARAAYGVILITTKKGKREQAPKLNVSSSYTVTSATNIPKYADSWEYITYMNTASINAGGSNYFDKRLMDHALKYYEDPVNNSPVYYDPEIDTNGKYNYAGNTDWASELYQNGILKQVNASLSGGTEKIQYFMSYGYLDQNGFLSSYDDTYRRHNINLNLNVDVLEWISVSGRAKYTYSFEDHPSGGSNGWSGISEYSGQLKNDLRPLMPVRHPDGSWAGQGSFTNPFAVGAEGGYDQRKVNDLWLTGAVEIRPIKDVKVNVDYTFNPYSWNKERTSRLFSEYWAEPGKSNIYPWVNPNSVALENSNDYYKALNAYADYTKSLEDHNFKVLVGYNQETKDLKWFYAKRENLIDNDLPAINRATGEDYVNGSASSWAVQGAFFRFNYNYAEKYFLEANGRYDSSSKFPKGDRAEFFPSVSAAWRFSEEGFWDGLKHVVSEAKLRASYGSLGNQVVSSSDFPYISNYGINTATSYMLGGILPVSVSPGSLVSPSFTWEEVNQWNIGADVGLWENKLLATVDVYQRNTIGMLTSGKPLPAVLGTGVPRENAADMKTYGWEFTATWKDRIKDFSYNVSFNIADYQSEITKFDNPTGDLGNYYVGQKINEIWGYEASGLFQTEEEIANHVDQSKLYGGQWNTGDVKYVNQNDDDEISWGSNTLSDHGDKLIIGNSTPRYQYGMQINSSWKGIDLNLFFQGVGKRDLWTGSNRFFGIGSQWDVPMKETLDYWSEDNKDARLPRPYINGGHGNRQVSTLYLQDASYIRLKQLTLGYTLPERWIYRSPIDKVRFYFTGQNIFTITKLSDLYDPENTDLMSYPVPKSYSFGLNLTF
ncbi:TonB-dependent receptor [Sunxiuqinia dokdonensis]|uniref:TonB-linked outer membrane protein n=1 Tax=Sunxiuqinia dokdonensis TaxID=1409788 RepID=A0A0L8V6K4_9BACT|nr:TonB-dependent receptor [Sunxiuqinia dokdonensis]KOH44071.1 tonB-linked outer membrane protein [Sunxiuqinia dokdonensis]